MITDDHRAGNTAGNLTGRSDNCGVILDLITKNGRIICSYPTSLVSLFLTTLAGIMDHEKKQGENTQERKSWDSFSWDVTQANKTSQWIKKDIGDAEQKPNNRELNTF